MFGHPLARCRNTQLRCSRARPIAFGPLLAEFGLADKPQATRALSARAALLCGTDLKSSLFHQPGSLGARELVVLDDAEPAGDLGIRLDHPAEILAEAVLVHLVVGLDVPQPARVGADLVGEHDPHVLALPQAPGFDLEVDEPDANPQEQAR